MCASSLRQIKLTTSVECKCRLYRSVKLNLTCATERSTISVKVNRFGGGYETHQAGEEAVFHVGKKHNAKKWFLHIENLESCKTNKLSYRRQLLKQEVKVGQSDVQIISSH